MMKLVCLLFLLGVVFASPEPRHQVVKRQTLNGHSWPNAIVFYDFNDDICKLPNLKNRFAAVENRAAFKEAAKEWERRTCVKFTEDPNALPRIRIALSTGGMCYAPPGRLPGVRLAPLAGCSKMRLMHEQGHMMGIMHEQQRYDRDDYVSVDEDNVRPSWKKDAYDKLPKEESDNFDVPYDFGSIMHYSGTKNPIKEGVPEMIPKDLKYVNSLRSFGITFYDTLLVNRLYKCFEKCASKAPPCINGGVVDVNDCNKCFCPLGFSGPFCEQPATGCSQFVPVTGTPTNTTLKEIGDFDAFHYIDREECTYVFQAPPGQRVQLIVREFNCWEGAELRECPDVGLEIRVGDLRNTGYRLCSMEADAPGSNQHTYASNSNQAVILHYVQFHGSSATIEAVAIKS